MKENPKEHSEENSKENSQRSAKIQLKTTWRKNLKSLVNSFTSVDSRPTLMKPRLYPKNFWMRFRFMVLVWYMSLKHSELYTLRITVNLSTLTKGHLQKKNDKIFGFWKKMYSSLVGKISIAKTFIYSQFAYLSTEITFTAEFINDMEKR